MKKTSKVLVVLSLLILLTGCTQRLTDKDKKPVTNKDTGQALTSNILCQPTDSQTRKLYEKNKVELKKLPQCEKFVPTDGAYDGLWTSIFVKPLAWFIIAIAKLVKNYGLAVMIAGLLIRCILIPISKKSAVQSQNMQKIKPELDKLERKYQNRTDKESQMMKSQELMMLYKKNDIHLFSGCLMAFIQLPLFIAFFEAINRTPAIFEGKFLTLHLGTTPLTGMVNGNWFYLIILLLVIASTYFSLSLAQPSASKEQEIQTKSMAIFMVVFMTIASLYIPVATALYWIASSLFTIIQTLIVRKGNKKGKKNGKK